MNMNINEGILTNYIAKKVLSKRITDMSVLLQYKMKNDPDNKEKYEQLYKLLSMAGYNEKGESRNFKDMAANLKELSSDKEFKSYMEKSGKEIDKIKKEDKDGWWDADSAEAENFEKLCTKDKEYLKLIKEYNSNQKDRTKNALKKAQASKKENDNKDNKEKDNKEKDNKEKTSEKSVKKDKDGNELKSEEITDPKTGKKKKVIMHVGPKGGKFYYPDGKPKTPENKIYAESLSEYLGRLFIID